MTDVAWPGGFPQKADLTGYDEKRAAAFETFKPDRPGRPLKLRRAVLTGCYEIQIPFRFPKSQFAAFETFWDVDLAEGMNNLLLTDEIRSGTRRIIFTETFKHRILAPTWMLVTLVGYSEPQ
jgi:hypothetical protein